MTICSRIRWHFFPLQILPCLAFVYRQVLTLQQNFQVKQRPLSAAKYELHSEIEGGGIILLFWVSISVRNQTDLSFFVLQISPKSRDLSSQDRSHISSNSLHTFWCWPICYVSGINWILLQSILLQTHRPTFPNTLHKLNSGKFNTIYSEAECCKISKSGNVDLRSTFSRWKMLILLLNQTRIFQKTKMYFCHLVHCWILIAASL